MEEDIIKTENLQKRYGNKIILDKINVTFKKGDSTALLGCNGSGKSTFLRMLCGLCSISEGRIIKDKNLRFNYIPENYSKINLTTDEYLKCVADIDKEDRKSLNIRLKDLYEKFKFDGLKDVPMKNLSKGSLQKAAIMQAFIRKCDVLLLDEPMTGLDVDSQEIFIAEVKKMLQEGVTLIMSCHEPYLVSSLCSKVYRIRDKKIVLSEISNYERMNTLVFEKNIQSKKQLNETLTGCYEYSLKDGKLVLKVKSSKSNEILLKMLNEGYVLEKFN